MFIPGFIEAQKSPTSFRLFDFFSFRVVHPHVFSTLFDCVQFSDTFSLSSCVYKIAV